jgi:hypothetical protein
MAKTNDRRNVWHYRQDRGSCHDDDEMSRKGDDSLAKGFLPGVVGVLMVTEGMRCLGN